MREYPLTLAPYFKVGLRSEYRSPRNRPGFVTLKNLQASSEGLVAYEPLDLVSPEDHLLSFGLGLEWPWPKLHHGKNFSTIFARNSIYNVHWQTGNITRLDTYDFFSQDDFLAIAPGGVWSVADMGNHWIAVNGASIVFHNNLKNALGEPDRVLVATPVPTDLTLYPLPVTCCNFKGRYLMGGFVNHFLLEGMIDMLETDANMAARGLSSARGVIDTFTDNTVWWSSIGGGDLYTILNHNNASLGYVGATEYGTSSFKYVYDLWRKNELGFASMEWQGLVRSLVSSKQFAVAYGDNGVTAFHTIVEPISTLGTKSLLPIGIISSGAAASDGDDQIFMDAEGELWQITSNLEMSKLGYKEHFRTFLGTDVVICYESSRRRFLIGNGFRQFALGSSGLYETTQPVTSAAYVRRPVCCGANPQLLSRDWNVLTDTFDMGNRGIKRVAFVSLTGELDGTVQGRFHYRYQSGADTSWLQSDWIYAYDNHIAANAEGIEFRLELKGTDFTNIRLEDASIRWQQSDKRFVRGAYQTQALAAAPNE